MPESIRRDLPVFLHDGDVAIGAVRGESGNDLIINIENAGDFTLPRNVVQDVHEHKVILDARKLDSRVLAAIGKAHSAEDDEDHTPVAG
jgi:predicted DNA binding protein